MGLSRFSSRRKNSTHLYTKGGEFSLDGKNYIGEYHLDGNTPKTGPVLDDSSQVLRRYYNVSDHYIYDKTYDFNIPILKYTDPKPYLYKPQDSVYVAGFGSRYFVEKVDDDNSYAMEVDQRQYDQVGKPGGIDGGLYLSTIIKWKFTGRREDIISHNELEIRKASMKLPTISYAIKNYLEFSRVTAV